MEPTAPNAEPAETAAPAETSTAPNPEKAAAARELVGGILERMGVQAELNVDDRADGIHVGIQVKGGGEALGQARRGGVVESITYLVNKALNRDEQGRKWILLEVAQDAAAVAAPADTAAPVDPAVRAVAEELAAKARKLGGTAWVGPLPQALRGLQGALAAMPGVRVKGEGEGIHRRLIIEAS